MKKLQIIRLDNDLVQKADLQIGNNIISRGAVTGRNDGPTVKNAVTINLAPNGEMKITPVRPCYIKSKDSSRWRLLKLGIGVPIKTGDVCSLLPEKCWFKVISVSNMMEDNDRSLKRKAEEDDSDSVVSDKRKCSDSTTNVSTDKNSNETVETVEAKEGDSMVQNEENVVQDANLLNDTKMAVRAELAIEDIYRASGSVQNEDKLHEDDSKSTICFQDTIQHLKDKEEKHRKDVNINIMYGKAGISDLATENTKQNRGRDESSSQSAARYNNKIDSLVSEEKASASVSNNNNNPTRNKCAYGKKCYRKNRYHKSEFSHPGDSDYELPDDRQECPYGIKCYRKNPQHRTQFKHTAVRRGRKRTLVQAPPMDNSSPMEESSYEESIDESDYEPSVYTDTSDGNRSDWDDNLTDSGENIGDWEDGTTG
ncbi:hypothetical protein KM043_001944 [Ampulex compressa]|nr:hypothetical protein KM043_001944 [Ampulex compressa]